MMMAECMEKNTEISDDFRNLKKFVKKNKNVVLNKCCNFATEILNGRCEVYIILYNYIKRNKLKTITY